MGAKRIEARAKEIGLSIAKLYRDAQNGKLVIRKAGRASLIFDEDWQRYMDEMLPKGASKQIPKQRSA